MAAYYNENDKKTASWLRELIKRGLIADGEVDSRSITDVQPADLRGFTQCHFFAGIGGWSYALRLAGWPDDRPVWTGSCPCQPFSQAGHGKGTADHRHLWPEFHWLVRDCRPPVVFGEQVASKAGRAWLGAVFADLEALAYRRAAADLCAASVGAPHIRQRLYWVADTEHAIWRTVSQHRQDGCDWENSRRPEAHGESGTCGEVRDGLADSDERIGRQRREERNRCNQGSDAVTWSGPSSSGWTGRLADTNGQRREGQRLHLQSGESREAISEVAWRSEAGRMGASSSQRLQERISLGRVQPETIEPHEREAAERRGNPWSARDWLPCLDGTSRPVESGTFPLAHGVPARVGRLRGYGNAIVPQVAAAFIEAYMDSLSGGERCRIVGKDS